MISPFFRPVTTTSSLLVTNSCRVMFRINSLPDLTGFENLSGLFYSIQFLPITYGIWLPCSANGRNLLRFATKSASSFLFILFSFLPACRQTGIFFYNCFVIKKLCLLLPTFWRRRVSFRYQTFIYKHCCVFIASRNSKNIAYKLFYQHGCIKQRTRSVFK